MDDADLAGEAFAKVRSSVEKRGSLEEEAANKLASDEINQMRAEKRERRPIFTR